MDNIFDIKPNEVVELFQVYDPDKAKDSYFELLQKVIKDYLLPAAYQSVLNSSVYKTLEELPNELRFAVIEVAALAISHGYVDSPRYGSMAGHRNEQIW